MNVSSPIALPDGPTAADREPSVLCRRERMPRGRNLRPPLTPLAGLLFSLPLILLAGDSLPGDEVVLRPPGDSGSPPQRRQGEVLEYSGRGLLVRLADGRREEYPAERVVEVRPERSAEHAAADRLLAQGRFADALTAYRQARRQESREWVRRLILAQETDCYAAEGQIGYAGDTFLSVVRSDPATPYFARIPLPWNRFRPPSGLDQTAAGWLSQTDLPAAQLLGAAWLLGSPERPRALETLRQLATHSDPRIAFLAEAQLWRTTYVSASSDEVDRWRERINRMPTDLRPGPYFVVGLALERHRRYEDAALAWLRVPILYPDRHELAAASLWQAAGSLAQAGQEQEARALLQELVRRYAASEYVGRARERLQSGVGGQGSGDSQGTGVRQGPVRE